MTTLYSSAATQAPATPGTDTADRVVSERLRRLQQVMHTEIPLTRSIGIQIVAYDGESLALGAPLAQNINDKGSVFSGSLGAVVTLAGWGLLWLLLEEQLLSGAIVIQDSAISYLRPVRRDFVARCRKPALGEIEQFRSALLRRGRARLAVEAGVWENDTALVSFSGRYVVQRS
jgi:thioesterase domain-containing protein